MFRIQAMKKHTGKDEKVNLKQYALYIPKKRVNTLETIPSIQKPYTKKYLFK